MTIQEQRTQDGRPLGVVCVITHVDEVTLGICRDAIVNQTAPPAGIMVVSGVSPASEACNRALDYACESGAELLVLVAADCILDRTAIATLLKRMDLSTVYCVQGRGFDFLGVGGKSPTVVHMFNMTVIQETFRLRDTFQMYREFYDRVEAATGMRRFVARPRSVLGYHHPIWRSREIFDYLLYVTPKFRMRVVRQQEKILKKCLESNPGNTVLQVGLLGLYRGMSDTHDVGSARRNAFREQWREVEDLVKVREDDYFAYHADMAKLASDLFSVPNSVNAMASSFFDGWPAGGVSLAVAMTRKELIRTKVRYVGAVVFSFSYSIYLHLPEPAKRVYRWIKGRLGSKHGLIRLVSSMNGARRTAYRDFSRHTKLEGRWYGGIGKNKFREIKRLQHPTGRNEVQHAAVDGVTGEFDAGRELWAERWAQKKKSHRVLLIAPTDFAGSMYKWAEAINRYTDYAARLVTFRRHQFGYPNDLVISRYDGGQRAKLLELADTAEILHLKDEYTWYRRPKNVGYVQLLDILFFDEEFASKAKIFTLYGGYARSFKSESAYVDSILRFNARIAMTPDLSYEWVKGYYIPHTIDTDKYAFSWSDSCIFAHSPSSPQRKATYLFSETVQYLQARHADLWNEWRADLISGVSFHECIQRKRKASLFFDQAGRDRVADVGVDDIVGWYGNSAIEAMAFGIPTMAHISDVALRRAASTGVDLSKSPVIRVARKRSSMVDAVLAFVRDEPEGRRELAYRTRAFVEAFHGYSTCGNRLAEVYASTKGAA